jgi:hypothetical protein
MIKKRLNLKCSNRDCPKDDRQYTYLVPLDSTAKVIVECPYCRTKGTVDLDPYRKPQQEIFRGGEGESASLGERFDFPDVIPTEALEE